MDPIKKTRYSIHSLFLVVMTYFFVTFIQEYHLINKSKEFMLNQIEEVRQSLYEEAREFSKALEYHESSKEQRAIEYSQKDNKLTIIDAHAPPPKVEETGIVSKINLLGVLEVELSETTSWATIIKMIITVLLTFTGYRAINLVFKRLEYKIETVK